MKKRVFALFILLSLCLSFTACNIDFGDWDGSKRTVVMYGVATHIKDLDHTCIYFPTAGHMATPRLKEGKASPEYSAGDLIKVTFTEVIGDIPIMESFPGQFGAEAEKIEVKKANVGFEIKADSFIFSDNVPEGAELTVGDKLNFNVAVGGLPKHIAEGEITNLTGGRYTAELTLYGTAEEFLQYIFEYDLKAKKQ